MGVNFFEPKVLSKWLFKLFQIIPTKSFLKTCSVSELSKYYNHIENWILNCLVVSYFHLSDIWVISLQYLFRRDKLYLFSLDTNDHIWQICTLYWQLILKSQLNYHFTQNLSDHDITAYRELGYNTIWIL